MTLWFPRMMRQLSNGMVGAAQDMTKSYEEAVLALNTLQSNASVLEKAKKERDRNRHLNGPATISFAARTGLKLDDLDKLSVIHVSGTKGKGSTCAFCERILREHGYKTGFYSSPHLVEVRERIRINGMPLSPEVFSSYFWDCYTKLDSTKDAHGGTMPAYFRFLTIMAFNVFLQEEVDVAIVEVGIGGQYDCTNILRSPVVCGVSTLDLDHTGVLGDTIDKIAWQKGGIFKVGVPAVTVPQPGNSLQVLIDRAQEIGTPLRLAPLLDSYTWSTQPPILGIPGRMQRVNASLALQLTSIWLMDHNKSIKERQQEYLDQPAHSPNTVELGQHLAVTEAMVAGLRRCEWPGRGQRVRRPGVTYFLDGAHTPSSMENCIDWYKKASAEEVETHTGSVVRVLFFNSTGDRKPKDLLQIIAMECEFDIAVFCPNIATTSNTADQTNHMVSHESMQMRVLSNYQTWLELVQCKTNSPSVAPPGGGVSKMNNNNNNVLSDKDKMADDGATATDAFTFHSIEETLAWMARGEDPLVPRAAAAVTSPRMPEKLELADHIQVLCTGSLHLIGGVLRLITPDINDAH